MTTWLRNHVGHCLAVILLLANTASFADPPSIELFARKAEFSGLKMSPDGKYIAALVPDQQHSALGIIRLADHKQVGQLLLKKDSHIEDFWWAKEDRIVASLAQRLGPLDTPRRTSEFVSINANGGDYQYLYGWRNRGLGWAEMVDPVADESNSVLIAVYGFKWEWDKKPARLYRLNIHSGALRKVGETPATGTAQIIVDPKGEVRYARMWTGGLSGTTYQREAGKLNWRLVDLPESIDASSVKPLRFSADGKSVFLDSGEFGPHSCLVQHVLETGERRKLACDDNADLSSPIYGFQLHSDPIAAVFEAGKPETKLLDSSNPDVLLLKSLMAAFQGKQVLPTSVTRDGSKALIYVYDDRSPGDYYLVDTVTQKADYFAGVKQWLDPEQMSERRPIHLKARDGTPLWGYLTLPKGVAAKQLPLVVNPHGGPFWVRDSWSFDTEAQLLASRGYAVLQINFRGSGGYGRAFIEAGRKAWGTTMIDDITDATRWTIAEGFADPARICIFGASYGGYAALMSAAREPDLYRCAIGYAGVYDLKLFRRDTDIAKLSSGRNYFDDAIAATDEEMIAQSPITYVDRIKAAVMLIHGEEDKHTPFSQAKAMKLALEQGHRPVEWLVRPGEGHGFWKTANVEALYQGVLDFLDGNIGKAGTAKTDTTISASQIARTTQNP